MNKLPVERRLLQYEHHIAQSLQDTELFWQIPFKESDKEVIIEIIQDITNNGQSEALDRIINSFPHTLAAFLILTAATEYNQGDYWPFIEATLPKITKNNINTLREFIQEYLQKNRLATLPDQLSADKYLADILLNTGFPRSVSGEVFNKLLPRLFEREIVNPDDINEIDFWVNTIRIYYKNLDIKEAKSKESERIQDEIKKYDQIEDELKKVTAQRLAKLEKIKTLREGIFERQQTITQFNDILDQINTVQNKIESCEQYLLKIPQANTFISFKGKEKKQLYIDKTNGVKASYQFHDFILSTIQNAFKQNIYDPEDAELLRQYQIALSRNELDLPEDLQKNVFKLLADFQVNTENQYITATEDKTIIPVIKQITEIQTIPRDKTGALVEQQKTQLPVVVKPPSLDVIPYPVTTTEQSIAEVTQNSTGIKTNPDSESEEETIYYRQWPSYTGWIQRFMNQSHGAADTSKMGAVSLSTTMGSALGRYEPEGIEDDKTTDDQDSINIQEEEEKESFYPIHQDKPIVIETNQMIEESLQPEPEAKTYKDNSESEISPVQTEMANGIKIIESDLFINDIKDKTTSIRDEPQFTKSDRQKVQEGKEHIEKASRSRRDPSIKNQTPSAKKGTIQKIVKKIQSFITSIIKWK